MTAIFATRLGSLIQTSFGVNEIASMITVGKTIGSVITRKSDASIFTPLENQYKIRVRSIPPWLSSVVLDRSGYILGQGMRKVRVPYSMADTPFDTVEGIATFLVLILRFVQPTDAILEDIEDLLRGEYGIINGGSLASGQTETGIDGEPISTNLPYGIKEILRSFIQAVIDADAQSPQRSRCLGLMSSLTNASGSSKFQRLTSRYVKAEHQKLLTFLLQNGSSGDLAKATFNTLSSGATMIALAAMANGANITVECVHENGIKPLQTMHSSSMPPSSASTKPSAIVRLWLTQPPTTILRDLNFATLSEWQTEVDDPANLPLVFSGGELELSLHVSDSLEIELKPDDALALWQEGLKIGRNAQFTTSRGKNQEISFAFTLDFLKSSQAPADLCQRTDELHRLHSTRARLDRVAASGIHAVYQYREYSSLEMKKIINLLQIVQVAIFVGSIKKLISNSSDGLVTYAWTGDVRRMLGMLEQLAAVETGLPGFQVIIAAARIWGGLTPQPLETPRSGIEGESVNSVVGIVCPQMVLISNILLDPLKIARIGIDDGFFSFYEGSAPLLPQDKSTGFIFAASPPYSRPPFTFDLNQKLPPLLAEDEDEDFSRLVFSTEIATSPHGTLGIGLCVWHLGNFVMLLNPSIVAFGLLSSVHHSLQSIENSASVRQGNIGRASRMLQIPFFKLQWLECGFMVRNGFCVIDLRKTIDWQIVAAGLLASPKVISFVTREEVDWSSMDSRYLVEDGTVILLRRPQAEPEKINNNNDNTSAVDLPNLNITNPGVSA